MNTVTWTSDEIMTVTAARSLQDRMSCFVGIGLPSTAANVARRTHAPGLWMIYESGTLGTVPEHLPLSIGDGILAENVTVTPEPTEEELSVVRSLTKT